MNKILTKDEVKNLEKMVLFILKINLISSGLINFKKELKEILRILAPDLSRTL